MSCLTILTVDNVDQEPDAARSEPDLVGPRLAATVKERLHLRNTGEIT
jgi:hypothetical protein